MNPYPSSRMNNLRCPWTTTNTSTTNSSTNSTNNSPPQSILPPHLATISIPTLDTNNTSINTMLAPTTIKPTLNLHSKSQPNSAITSSSVSSPSAPDSDCAAEVDELLEGIDRARIDDLWTTPRGIDLMSRTDHTASFRAGLFAPPDKSGAIAAIAPPPSRTRNTAQSIRNENTNLSNTLQFQHMFANTTTSTANNNLPRSKSLAAPDRSHSIHRSIMTPALSTIDATLVNTSTATEADFPRLFKVSVCPNRESCIATGNVAECFYYHSMEGDRRRINVAIYKPHMCRFIEEAGGCRKGDRCPFAHNDFERRYHPDRYGKETCRDFLRGDCPRRYCTFRHEVSNKVEVALEQMSAMNDKELLQLVLKIDEQNGRALCEKLLRRFGHGKKHSGWKLEGFNPKGRDDQKVKFVTARVDHIKKALRIAGEKKWAASLKTTSLRDMMSGVRKVAEEMRERCRNENNQHAESGSEVHRLIRSVFSNTNWSCHSQEGDNPFLVTPDNQNDAINAMERLVELLLNNHNIQDENKQEKNENRKPQDVKSDLSSENVSSSLGGRFASGYRSNHVYESESNESRSVLRNGNDTDEVSNLWDYCKFGQLTA